MSQTDPSIVELPGNTEQKRPALFSWEELVRVSNGQPVSQDVNPFDGARLWTDTRTISGGDFFIPLRGERFDGHHYLQTAFEQGAIGAFIAQDAYDANPTWALQWQNLIVVPDPVMAYLAMAGYHRKRIGCKVIAVTGSSGKTTVKDMLFAAFSKVGKTQKTAKNFNNEVGVSLSLLDLQPSTEFMVLEMGMRGLNQIAPLSLNARPDLAIVTNIGPAHIGLLGSMENIASAKAEILTGLSPDTGIGLVNGDDPLLVNTAKEVWAGRLETFRLSEAENLTVTAQGQSFTYKGVSVSLSVSGEHQVSNALCVLKAGELLGQPLPVIADGLSSYNVPEGRGTRVPLTGFRDAWLINDAYNANPSSFRAGLAGFFQSMRLENEARLANGEPRLKVTLILAAMNELGEFTSEYHRQLGVWLAQELKGFPVEAVVFIGQERDFVQEGFLSVSLAPKVPFLSVPDLEDGVEQLVRNMPEPYHHTLFYLKGSRGYQLERFPDVLAQILPKNPVGKE